MAIVFGRISPRPSPNRYAPFELEDFGDGNRIDPLPFSFSGTETLSRLYQIRQLYQSVVTVGGSGASADAVCAALDTCGPQSTLEIVDAPVSTLYCAGGIVEFTEMSRGDTVELDGHATLAGADYPLVGKTLWFTGKTSKALADTAATWQRTIGNGITLIDSAKGKYRVKLVPGNTSGLPALKTLVYWDIQAKDANGNVYTLIAGQVIIKPDVTVST